MAFYKKGKTKTLSQYDIPIKVQKKFNCVNNQKIMSTNVKAKRMVP